MSVVDLVFGRLQTRSRKNFSHAIARSRPRAARRSVGSIGASQAIQLRPLLFCADWRSTVISLRPMSSWMRNTSGWRRILSTIGIPIVAGREFTRTDDENSPPVAIINETMAGKILAGKRSDRPAPQGQRQMDADRRRGKKCELPRPSSSSPTVVFLCAGSPEFLCRKQHLIRTRESPAAIRNALAREVHALDPNSRRWTQSVCKSKSIAWVTRNAWR